MITRVFRRQLSSQTCGSPDADYCQPCDFGCPHGPCLTRIIEGDREMSFCGVPCTEDEDCPGGMGCADSYQQCIAPGDGTCPSGLICFEIEVLNEGWTPYCSDPDEEWPEPVGRYCGPRQGRCE